MKSRLENIHDWEALAVDSNYRLATLAAKCHISQRQLSRFFLETFGITAKTWMGQLRLQKAPLLVSKGLSNKIASFELGFKQPSHFCREFRRVYGTSPRVFQLKQLVPAKILKAGAQPLQRVSRPNLPKVA